VPPGCRGSHRAAGSYSDHLGTGHVTTHLPRHVTPVAMTSPYSHHRRRPTDGTNAAGEAAVSACRMTSQQTGRMNVGHLLPPPAPAPPTPTPEKYRREHDLPSPPQTLTLSTILISASDSFSRFLRYINLCVCVYVCMYLTWTRHCCDYDEAICSALSVRQFQGPVDLIPARYFLLVFYSNLYSHE